MLKYNLLTWQIFIGKIKIIQKLDIEVDYVVGLFGEQMDEEAFGRLLCSTWEPHNFLAVKNLAVISSFPVI